MLPLWWYQHYHIVLKFYGGMSLKNLHFFLRSFLTERINIIVIVSYNLDTSNDGDKSLNNNY